VRCEYAEELFIECTGIEWVSEENDVNVIFFCNGVESRDGFVTTIDRRNKLCKGGGIIIAFG
jgi:hypothetical protein